MNTKMAEWLVVSIPFQALLGLMLPLNAIHQTVSILGHYT
jgi:hypothetical protein